MTCFNDLLVPDFFAFNSNNPFIPQLEAFAHTVIHSAPLLRFQMLRCLLYFLPAFLPLFLLSNASILFFSLPDGTKPLLTINHMSLYTLLYIHCP